jgi:hypothetical protein
LSPHAPTASVKYVAATIVGCPGASVIGAAGSPLAGGTLNGVPAIVEPPPELVVDVVEPCAVSPCV